MARPLVILSALILWVAVDYRALKRALADFEDEGVTRRSDQARSPFVMRRLFVVLPLVVFLALAGLFLYRLGTGDPSRIPSALIGRARRRPICRRSTALCATARRCPGSPRKILPAR